MWTDFCVREEHRTPSCIPKHAPTTVDQHPPWNQLQNPSKTSCLDMFGPWFHLFYMRLAFSTTLFHPPRPCSSFSPTPFPPLRRFSGPFGDIGDPDGYRAQCNRGAALGMEGKWAIHPSQAGGRAGAQGPRHGARGMERSVGWGGP